MCACLVRLTLSLTGFEFGSAEANNYKEETIYADRAEQNNPRKDHWVASDELGNYCREHKFTDQGYSDDCACNSRGHGEVLTKVPENQTPNG